MADDVVLSKAASIERCVARIREVYADNDENLWDNHTTQDSIPFAAVWAAMWAWAVSESWQEPQTTV